MAKRKILVTGAVGKIAGQLLPAFQKQYDLTLLDISKTGRTGNGVPGVQIADLCDPNREAYRHHFKDIDTVVHFGYVRVNRKDREAHFSAEMQNVQMAYHIYQTALEENVRRVIITSSNHAADYYEPLILDGRLDTVHPNDPALAVGFYGWAKATYEHLGFVYALGKQMGKPLPNVQIRIGGPRETDIAQKVNPGDLKGMRRALGAYISERDMQQLYIKSIETEDIRNEHGVPFQIFYGVSGNHHNFWSLSNARKVIDYAPEDNSEVRFADQIAEHIRANQGEEAPA
ncbi:MAG: NAD(P)-dependent oxidoreductase [bacterium]|nr:NAD(P)-dependent oxidoreductase [bacterium]